MSQVASVLAAIFWGLLLLSLLVFVHEGGHYLAARALGVRVTEFFLGLPCRARLSHKSASHGTEVGVTPVLLGGYTRICGMSGEDDPLLADALACVQRAGRASAADVASELGVDEDRALGMLATLSDWASLRPFYDPDLGEREGQAEWPERFETMRRDARGLTEYDGGHDFSQEGTTEAGQPRPVDDAAAFLAQERSHTYQGHGFPGRLGMLIAGPAVNVVVALVIVVVALMAQGVSYVSDTNVVSAVEPGSLAEEAGIEAGDAVTCVAGTETDTWGELADALDGALSAGVDFEVTYEHEGASRTAVVALDAPAEVFGVSATMATYHPSLPEALRAALSYAGAVAAYALRLIVPTQTVSVLDQSTSVVGISAQAAQAASLGPGELALFAAAVSMSLGFMNLLPIPPLDGGKIVIEAVAALRRRPVSVRAQNIVSYVGLAFFLFVFAYVLRNDIVRFVLPR